MAQNIFLMQIGFMLLEVGSVRAMHAKAICVKNCADFLVCTTAWLMIGFPIAFSEGEFVGQKGWFAMDAPDPDNETMYWPKWFFQWSFASATCTIVSGAGAERCSFLGYLVSTFLLSSFVYPIVVHSMWSDQAWLANGEHGGLIAYDFAGSGVVHLTGGVGAFFMAWTAGPRDGRFGSTGAVQSLAPHNLVMAATGGLFLTCGWFAFNGGSVGNASGGGARNGARICAVTAIGAAAGGLYCLIFIWIRSHFIKLEAMINGMLAGLVSVTAGCSVFHPMPTVAIGLLGGAIYMAASEGFLWVQVDDPLDATAIHGVCGVWGLIAVGLFGNGNGGSEPGVFYGGENAGKLLGSQIVCALFIIGWASFFLGGAFNFIWWYDKGLLRVPIDIELQGDLVLYGGSAYPQFGKDEGDPPQTGDMIIVVTDVLDSTVLWGWNPEAMLEATELMEERLRDNIVRFNGFEFASDETDSLSLVFHSSFDAVRFCLVSQQDLMNSNWPMELDSHPSSAREDSYAGLRVRMAIDMGYGIRTLVNKRLCFEGPVVESCKALVSAIEDGAVVVANTLVIDELQQRFSHKLFEIGEHTVQDLGAYDLPGQEKNYPLVQMLPQQLHDRPPTKIKGGEMTLRPYTEAPGVEEMATEGAIKSPITLVFCTLGPSGADTDERTRRESARATAGARASSSRRMTATDANRLTEEEMQAASADAASGRFKTQKAENAENAMKLLKQFTHRCEGYLSKTSHGVSLLAFPTAGRALEFISDLRSEIDTEKLNMHLSAGLHAGLPSSVNPNRTTGRADYLGPVVNVAARLLSLAGSRKQLFGSETSSVAVSAAVNELLSDVQQKGYGMEMTGKFTLKGVEEEVEVYSIEPETLSPFDAMQLKAAGEFKKQGGDVEPGTVK